jgi:putative spermidine/putrescine transport system substrate-binding protein
MKALVRLVPVTALVLVAFIAIACAPVAPVAPAPGAPTSAPAATNPTSAPPPAGKSVVNVYTDGDTNISDWLSNKIKPAFEAAYPQYELNVTTVRGVGNGVADIAARALAAKETGADPQAEVFDWDPRARPEYIESGLFEKLDSSNVPNAKNVPAAYFLSEYGMPYRGSQVLLAYDSAKVPENEVPKTFAELVEWVKAHPGQFVYNRPDKGGSGGNFVVRAIYEVTGKDPTLFKAGEPDPALVAQFPKAWELLRSIHPAIYQDGAYPNGNNPVLELLANGSVSMASVWSDQSRQALNRGVLPETIKVVQFTDLPMPGSYAPLSVVSNAKNKQGALDFVNFMLAQEQQTSVVQDIAGFPAIEWSMLPQDLQTEFTSIIASSVPYWPGGKWDTERNKGWYENVATNIPQDSP